MVTGTAETPNVCKEELENVLIEVVGADVTPSSSLQVSPEIQ